jgi:WD40 repeat protein
VYDIVPTIAAPHSTSINAIAATPDLRWVFSGGTDGYIRKFDWVDTANAKVALTVAQRHPFVDSVTKAGVLLSYWENEEPQRKSHHFFGSSWRHAVLVLKLTRGFCFFFFSPEPNDPASRRGPIAVARLRACGPLSGPLAPVWPRLGRHQPAVGPAR